VQAQSTHGPAREIKAHDRDAQFPLAFLRPSHYTLTAAGDTTLVRVELAALKQLDYRGWRAKTIDITYQAGSGRDGLIDAQDRINAEARAAIDVAYSLIILSDREVGASRVPISSLLAVGSVHHHLVADHARTLSRNETRRGRHGVVSRHPRA